MLQKILLTTTALLFMSGCVTKEIVPPPVAPIITQVTPPTPILVENFAGERLHATPEVSKMVQRIRALESHSAYLEFAQANQNIHVGNFLNLSLKANVSGYLKLIIINPYGERSLLLPNGLSRGYLQAQHYFNANNEAFGLKTSKPTGLHYLVVIFSEKNARMVMQQGSNGYNALQNEQDLYSILERIKSGDFGKNHISLYPIRIHN